MPWCRTSVDVEWVCDSRVTSAAAIGKMVRDVGQERMGKEADSGNGSSEMESKPA